MRRKHQGEISIHMIYLIIFFSNVYSVQVFLFHSLFTAGVENLLNILYTAYRIPHTVYMLMVPFLNIIFSYHIVVNMYIFSLLSNIAEVIMNTHNDDSIALNLFDVC